MKIKGRLFTDCSSGSATEAVNLYIFYAIQFDSDHDHRADLFLCPVPGLFRDHDRRPRHASHDVHDALDYGSGSVCETQKSEYQNCDLRNDVFALSVWKK